MGNRGTCQKYLSTSISIYVIAIVTWQENIFKFIFYVCNVFVDNGKPFNRKTREGRGCFLGLHWVPEICSRITQFGGEKGHKDKTHQRFPGASRRTAVPETTPTRPSHKRAKMANRLCKQAENGHYVTGKCQFLPGSGPICRRDWSGLSLTPSIQNVCIGFFSVEHVSESSQLRRKGRQTCPEPWVDTAPNLVPPSIHGCETHCHNLLDFLQFKSSQR